MACRPLWHHLYLINLMTIKKQHGFTISEFMVTLVVASLLSIGIVSAFTSQSMMYVGQVKHDQATQGSRDSFDALYRLIQQAVRSSITVGGANCVINATQADAPAEIATDSISINLNLPAGVSIWPNVNGPGFTDTAVRIQWSSTGNNQNTILVNNGPNSTSLGTPITLIGSTNARFNQIANLDLASLDANGNVIGNCNSPEITGYNLVVTNKRAGAGPNNKVALVTYQGILMPRN